jgi:hypothetical protein
VGQPKAIHFYRCMRPMQDRFVAATRRTAPPAPLLFSSARRTTAWVLLAASAVLLVAATVVLMKGWGDVASPLALHQRPMLAVDALLFSAAAYCFVHATVVLRAFEALPYRAGMYVFPACVVDASGPVLRVWSVRDADAIERLPQPALALRMLDGERIVVPAASAEEVEHAEAALRSLRPELTRALAEDDGDMLAELDPLHQTRVSSPLSSTQGMKPFSAMWARLDWVLALAIGVALGLGLGSLRNASSDERMYRTVAAAGSVPMFEQYLTRGGRHSDEVRDVFLARAALYDAQRQGTLEALQEFVRTHPDSKIGPEIDASMRRALLVELDRAKAVGTVGALDEFVHKFPDSHLDPEIKAARHVLYTQAFAAWKKKSQADAAVSAFIERLLASAEKAGAACEVRFRFKPAKTLEEVDKRIAKHPYYPGPDALPSHYVTAEAMRPREQRVAQAVADGFAASFPADVLAVHPGEPLAADAPAPTGVPTLVLEYAAEWSSATTASAKPRTIFAGIRFDFDARFLLPKGEGAPLQLSLKSWRGPELWKIKGGGMTLEEFHRKVYDAMIDRGFDDWQKKLTESFFR